MPTDVRLAHLVRRDWLTDGPLNELLASYIEVLQNRRYARNTLSAYLRCLGHFKLRPMAIGRIWFSIQLLSIGTFPSVR